LPTLEAEPRFLSEYDRLLPAQQVQFRRAVRAFVRALRAWEDGGCRGIPRFPESLGVKSMQGHRNIMEFAWAPDGRCTRRYGPARRTGRAHVIWRRIGTHDIYDDP
jgi:hypothetical protein